MQHLNEEQLVEHYYRDGDRELVQTHLRACADCAAQYETLRRVLSFVSEAPIPERRETYGTEVWNRLRWKLGAPSRRRWEMYLAAAAMLAIAFFAGQLWRAKQTVTTQDSGLRTQNSTVSADTPNSDRLMFVVVGDHLDSSERMLVEVSNGGSAVSPERAEDLLTANRIYRQTASQRGDERIAELLSDLEPILLELAHAGSSLEGEKLADLQKRIESKGLLFKVRVMSAQAADAARPAPPSETTSL